MTKKRAVFFDRDGTLIKGAGDRPINTYDEVKFFDQVPRLLSKIKCFGLDLIVVTNQGGIGLGYTTIEACNEIHAYMNLVLADTGGAELDAFYVCPHKPAEGCYCRKPSPGMILKAAEERSIDLSKSYFIGDHANDMEAATRAGIKKRFYVIPQEGWAKKAESTSHTVAFPTIGDAMKAVILMEEMSNGR